MRAPCVQSHTSEHFSPQMQLKDLFPPAHGEQEGRGMCAVLPHLAQDCGGFLGEPAAGELQGGLGTWAGQEGGSK